MTAISTTVTSAAVIAERARGVHDVVVRDVAAGLRSGLLTPAEVQALDEETLLDLLAARLSPTA